MNFSKVIGFLWPWFSAHIPKILLKKLQLAPDIHGPCPYMLMSNSPHYVGDDTIDVGCIIQRYSLSYKELKPYWNYDNFSKRNTKSNKIYRF
jgi:hypothetical protein